MRDLVKQLRFFPSMLFVAISIFSGIDSNAQRSDFNTPFGAGLVESFELIALRNEYGDTGWAPVRKWVEPVRVFVDSRSGLIHIQKKLVTAHLANLARITGHDIQTTTDQKKANTLLVFDREKNLRSLADTLMPEAQLTNKFLNKSVCFATFYLNSDSSIRKAVIIIPVDRARARAKLPTCVIEELTQIMGLVNDSDKVFPSIFNDKSIDEQLSQHDIRLLKLLYHPTVKAGMSREQVMPVIRGLVRTL
ncbi:MAG: hypothetical protein ACI9GW_001490 [Halieaceae bacterium]|jgi:hypothetical protein